MTNLLTSKTDKAKALELATNVLERLQADRLTRVPLLHLEELPAISGIYFAASDGGNVLYIGKADDFTSRCKLSQHHKLPTAIEKSATHLLLARVPEHLAWAVEQKLIDELAPPLNESVSRWWTEKPAKQKPSNKLSPNRKRRTYNLDERTIEVLAELAADDGISTNRYLEILLFNLGIEKGKLPSDAKLLGELRGGDRTRKEDNEN